MQKITFNTRRDGRVDYGGSLENCWRRKSPVGSNPTPSAKYLWFMTLLYTLVYGAARMN